MALNKRTVKELAAKLKVEATVLEGFYAALDTAEADETKQEDKSGVLLAGDTIMLIPKHEFSKPTPGTLLYNYQQQRYESGRTDGLEVTLKGLKEKLKVPAEVAVNSFEDLLKHSNETVLKEAKLEPNTALENLKKDKEILQAKVLTLEGEITKVRQDGEGLQHQFSIKARVLEAANKLQIDADASVLNGQRTLLMEKFLSEHEILGDGSVVNKITKKPLQDANLNNLDVDKALQSFAPTYVKLKDGTPDNGGRGDGSTTGTLPVGEVKNIKTRADMDKYLKEKSIVATSDEAMTILREVKKTNPDYK